MHYMRGADAPISVLPCSLFLRPVYLQCSIRAWEYVLCSIEAYMRDIGASVSVLP